MERRALARCLKEYREKVRSYARKRLKKTGGKVNEYTTWGNDKTHKECFEALCRVGNLNRRTVLDVGCGRGDFLDFLNIARIDIGKYTGIDVVREFVSAARKRHPGYEFIQGDFLTRRFPRNSYDYIFGAGIFTLDIACWKEIVFKTVKKMHDICRLGLAVNFMPVHNEQDRITCCPEAEEIKTLLSGITSSVTLSKDYSDHDFVIYLYKR